MGLEDILFNVVCNVQDESRELSPSDPITTDDNIPVHVDVHESVVQEK